MPKSSADQLRDNLNEIEDIKGQIRQAIIAKETEVPLDTPFSEYPQKIEDIQTKEDLDNVLNTQDEKIAELEAALDNKTAGANVKLNVFAQTTEPTKKDGIWLQTNKPVDNYIAVNEINLTEGWGNLLNTTLPYSFTGGSAVLVNDEIYMFGVCNYGGNWDKAVKLNLNTLEYTPLADTPVGYFREGYTAYYDGYVYLFYNNNNKDIYKYNITTNTYTNVTTTVPSNIGLGTSALHCQDMNNAYFGYSGKLYKFNFISETFTQISSSIGTSYMFGQVYNGYIYYIVKYSQTGIYKVNLSTGLTTQLLSTLPSPISSSTLILPSTCLYDNLLYIFSPYYDSSSSSKKCYKYNISTNELTSIDDAPANYNYSQAVLYKGNILIIGGSSTSNNIRQYNLSFIYEGEEDNVCFVTQKTGTYSTELISMENFPGLKYKFNDVFYYTIQGGLDNTIPTYYGDGTQWINFKNPPQNNS